MPSTMRRPTPNLPKQLLCLGRGPYVPTLDAEAAGLYRRGQRARVRIDYQDFNVRDDRVIFPPSFGLDALSMLNRDGTPLLEAGDRLVEVRIEPAPLPEMGFVDLVIRKSSVVSVAAASIWPTVRRSRCCAPRDLSGRQVSQRVLCFRCRQRRF